MGTEALRQHLRALGAKPCHEYLHSRSSDKKIGVPIEWLQWRTLLIGR
jgi:hypothetical protein